MKIYLAGPMSIETADGYDTVPPERVSLFEERAAELIGMDHDVFNPALNDLLFPGLKRAEYLAIDLAELVFCDTVALLPGYEQSAGVCRVELPVALSLGLQVVNAYTLKPIPQKVLVLAIQRAWRATRRER